MNRSLRSVRRLLALPGQTTTDAFSGQARRFAVAQTVIRCFYAFLLYLAISQFDDFESFVARPVFAPLWPVIWLPWTHSANAARVLLAFYAGGTLLAAIWPGPRWTRLLAALGFLEFVALKYSYGKIGHSLHLPLCVSWLLVFLPAGWEIAAGPAGAAGRRLRQGTLLVFWTCQAAILLSYTMAGLGKLGGAAYQVAAGQPNAFLPSALAAHIAQRLLQTNSTSALGEWIIAHPGWTWPLMPLPIYLEFFSFWIAFRPPLQRLWAAALIVFHMATYFTMTISFPQSCFLLAIFFFPSPWAAATNSFRTMFLNLPLGGDFARLWLGWRPIRTA
jgi:hypothetical protein